jgi:release factor glutamine methyltransferase
MAVKNALKNNMQDHTVFKTIDVLNTDFINRYGKAFDVIVSNPPYISDEEFQLLPAEVKTFEPAQALRAKDNGLFFYKYISGISSALFQWDSKPKYVLFEVGYDQSDHVKNILLQSGFKNIEIIKDYNHIPRVVSGFMNI